MGHIWKSSGLWENWDFLGKFKSFGKMKIIFCPFLKSIKQIFFYREYISTEKNPCPENLFSKIISFRNNLEFS